ncbi:hypothetical protein JCM33374_g1289 [Metschnikowia sp. JCM 33374]|nr:hypothetical protein JCM33374_g1289 [Metschnikowia sp. JCM 33374]
MISSSAIACKNVRPTNKNTKALVKPSLKPSQNIDSSDFQSEIESLEQLMPTHLTGKDERLILSTAFPASDAITVYASLGDRLSGQLNRSSETSQDVPANDAWFRNTRTSVPDFHSQKPNLPSVTPINYSFTDFLNKLPQQISKAPLREDSFRLLEKFTIPSRVGSLECTVPSVFSSPEFTKSPDEILHLQEPQKGQKSGSKHLESLPTLESFRPSITYGISTNLKKTLAKLEPVIFNIASGSCPGGLVKILSEFNRHVSLDEFYNLLYNTQNFVEDILKVESSTSSKLKEVKIIHLVLVTLRYPQSTFDILPYKFIHKLRVSAAKYQEILRTSLVIKIILVAIQRVKSPFASQYALPRATLYKLYYIISQQLILKYPEFSRNDVVPKNVILGQVTIGKIINLIHPNLTSKRLGQRGHSKAHYIGLILNCVDADTLYLLNFDLPQLKGYFANIMMRVNEAHRQIQADSWEKEGSIHDIIAPSLSVNLSATHNPNPSYIYAKEKSGEQASPESLKQKPRSVRGQSMGSSFIWKDPWKH